MLTHITVKGAREHNLKGVDVAIPRESLTVITGLSGSGKSSLAFDTIYAEGQRRYVESLSAYARQFLEMMQKPDVEHIDGLSPAISIEQKTTSRNPRSTVATVTEIYDYMRLLWARVGIPYSPATGLPIEAQQVSQMVDRVMALPQGSRHYLLAPVVRGRKGEYRKELAEWQKAGFTRVRIDGEFHDIEDAPALDKKYKHDIEVVVDRIVVREGIEARLADLFETALKLADGLAFLDPADPPEGTATAESGMKLDYAPPGRILFSQKFACPVSGFTIAEIEPRLFSFNAPQGACPACDGLGESSVFDEDLVVPNHALSLKKGAVVPWAKSQPPSPYYMQVLASLARAYDFDLDTPWGQLPEEAQSVILHGTRGRPVTLRFIDGKRSYEVKKPFEGVIGNLNRRMAQTESAWIREELSRYQSPKSCEVCHGARLKPEALSVKIAGEDISLSTRRSVADAYDWFGKLEAKLTAAAAGNRPRDLEGNQRAAGFPPQCRARLSAPRPDQRNIVRRRKPAYSPGEPNRFGTCRASCTSSMNPRSGFTRRTTTGCWKPSSASNRSATRSWWSNMTKTRSAPPTISSTWDPAPASMAAKWSPRAP